MSESIPVPRSKEEVLDILKPKSLVLFGTVIQSNYNAQRTPETGWSDFTNMKPFTFNENQGVIVYAGENGSMIATPTTEESRGLLEAAGFIKDESRGVPWLNNKDTWKGNGQKEVEEYADFRTWEELVKDSE